MGNDHFGGQGPAVLASTWAGAGLTTIVLALRFWTRLRISSHGEWALFWAIQSWAIALTAQAFLTYGVIKGIGNNASHLLSLTDSSIIPTAIKWGWISSSIAVIAITFAKISIIAFLLAVLANTHSKQRIFLYFLGVSSAITQIPNILLSFFQCNPTSALWHPATAPSGTGVPFVKHSATSPYCPLAYPAYVYDGANGLWNIVTDIALGLYPIFLMYRIGIPLALKIGLCFLIVIAIAASGASVARREPQLRQLTTEAHNSTHDLGGFMIQIFWGMWLCLLITSIPPIWPLVRHLTGFRARLKKEARRSARFEFFKNQKPMLELDTGPGFIDEIRRESQKRRSSTHRPLLSSCSSQNPLIMSRSLTPERLDHEMKRSASLKRGSSKRDSPKKDKIYTNSSRPPPCPPLGHNPPTLKHPRWPGTTLTKAPVEVAEHDLSPTDLGKSPHAKSPACVTVAPMSPSQVSPLDKSLNKPQPLPPKSPNLPNPLRSSSPISGHPIFASNMQPTQKPLPTPDPRSPSPAAPRPPSKTHQPPNQGSMIDRPLPVRRSSNNSIIKDFALARPLASLTPRPPSRFTPTPTQIANPDSRPSSYDSSASSEERELRGYSMPAPAPTTGPSPRPQGSRRKKSSSTSSLTHLPPVAQTRRRGSSTDSSTPRASSTANTARSASNPPPVPRRASSIYTGTTYVQTSEYPPRHFPTRSASVAQVPSAMWSSGSMSVMGGPNSMYEGPDMYDASSTDPRRPSNPHGRTRSEMAPIPVTSEFLRRHRPPPPVPLVAIRRAETDSRIETTRAPALVAGAASATPLSRPQSRQRSLSALRREERDLMEGHGTDEVPGEWAREVSRGHAMRFDARQTLHSVRGEVVSRGESLFSVVEEDGGRDGAGAGFGRTDVAGPRGMREVMAAGDVENGVAELASSPRWPLAGDVANPSRRRENDAGDNAGVMRYMAYGGNPYTAEPRYRRSASASVPRSSVPGGWI